MPLLPEDPAHPAWGPVRRRLEEGLRALGLEPAPARVEALLRYLGLLARWGRAYNLTAVREPAAMVHRHLLDSLAVLPWVRGPRVLDAGTGAGLPGIPLAVWRPGLRFVLLDSVGKKLRFVRQGVLELGLKHVEVVQARMERWRAPPFATVLARAVAPLPELPPRLGHLVARPEGRLLVLLGEAPSSEVLEALPPGWEAEVHPLAVPGLDARRHLAVLRPPPGAPSIRGNAIEEGPAL